MLDTMPWASTSGCLFMIIHLSFTRKGWRWFWKDLVFYIGCVIFELILLEIDHLYYNIIQLPGLEWSFPSCISLIGLHNSLHSNSHPRMSIETQLWIEHPPNPGHWLRPLFQPQIAILSSLAMDRPLIQTTDNPMVGQGVDTFNLSQLSHHDPGREQRRRGGWSLLASSTRGHTWLCMSHQGWVTGIFIMKYNTFNLQFPSNRIPIRWL